MMTLKHSRWSNDASICVLSDSEILMSSDLRNKHLFLTAHHSFENYVEKYHYYSLYLCEDGRCSKTEMDSLIWELVSSVKSGSLLRSALVFSMKLL